MRSSSVILSLLAANSVISLPLNINLGAYSPALVVGDGGISFGGAGEAEALVNTLATATGGAQAVGAGLTPSTESTSEGSPVIIAPAEATVPGVSSDPSLPSGEFGVGRRIGPHTDSVVEKRDLDGFNAALKFVSDALKTSPGIELGTGESGSGVGITVKPGGAIARRAM